MDRYTRFGRLDEVRAREDEEQGMASLEEGEGKLLLTLYRLKRLMKEHPRIREELAVLQENVEDELLQLGWIMEQDRVADYTTEEEEVLMTDDVADMTVTEDGLELDQVGPGSCSLHTYIYEDTCMEEHHDDEDMMDDKLEDNQVEQGSCNLSTWMDEVSIGTCVSFGHLVDGPCAGRGKTSLPMLWSILPWVFMMEPCMEKQGLLMFAGLVGVCCDLMAEGTKTRDKGGT